MFQLERWLTLSLDADMGSEMGALQNFLDQVGQWFVARSLGCVLSQTTTLLGSIFVGYFLVSCLVTRLSGRNKVFIEISLHLMLTGLLQC